MKRRNTSTHSNASYDMISTLDMESRKKLNQDFGRNPNETFEVQPSTFITFSRKGFLDEIDPIELNENWKFHLSVSPDSLSDAWDIIYPIAHEYADYFKIVNINGAKINLDENLVNLQNLQSEHESFIERYKNGQFNKDELLQHKFAKSISGLEDSLNESQIYEQINSTYLDEIKKIEVNIDEAKRMINGMQVTIYIPPGNEQYMLKIISLIEKKLKDANIPPGKIHNTDRGVGTYASIRNAGKGYQSALTVDSYNPDNKKDPFAINVVPHLDTVIEELEKYNENNNCIIDDALRLLRSVKEQYETKKMSATTALNICNATVLLLKKPDKYLPTYKEMEKQETQVSKVGIKLKNNLALLKVHVMQHNNMLEEQIELYKSHISSNKAPIDENQWKYDKDEISDYIKETYNKVEEIPKELVDLLKTHSSGEDSMKRKLKTLVSSGETKHWQEIEKFFEQKSLSQKNN
jgi:hypothetical protein